MLRLRRLRDDQWDWIKDILPGRVGSVGVTAADNRLFVDAVLYRYRTGIPWRDLPNDLGSWKNIHRRFSRWAKRGVWAAILGVLAQDADNEYAMIDSTVVRAHQHSAGARKVDGDQAIGRSRGGLSTKIHALVDALGNPIKAILTGDRPMIWPVQTHPCQGWRRQHYWQTRRTTPTSECSSRWRQPVRPLSSRRRAIARTQGHMTRPNAKLVT
jgi:transposase